MVDFRALTTKVQKNNLNKTKSLKETNLVLEACKKEYQKLYFEHEHLKKKDKEQHKKLLKYRNHYRSGQTTNKTPQDRNIELSNIEFNEEKLENILSVTQNRKPKKKRYYNDVYSDDGIEFDGKFSEIDDEGSNEELSKKRKRLKKGREL